MVPVVIGVLSGFAVSSLLPNDPCNGAFTADGQFIPLLVVPLVTLGAIALFWAKIWRR